MYCTHSPTRRPCSLAGLGSQRPSGGPRRRLAQVVVHCFLARTSCTGHCTADWGCYAHWRAFPCPPAPVAVPPVPGPSHADAFRVRVVGPRSVPPRLRISPRVLLRATTPPADADARPPPDPTPRLSSPAPTPGAPSSPRPVVSEPLPSSGPGALAIQQLASPFQGVRVGREVIQRSSVLALLVARCPRLFREVHTSGRLVEGGMVPSSRKKRERRGRGAGRRGGRKAGAGRRGNRMDPERGPRGPRWEEARRKAGGSAGDVPRRGRAERGANAQGSGTGLPGEAAVSPHGTPWMVGGQVRGRPKEPFGTGEHRPETPPPTPAPGHDVTVTGGSRRSYCRKERPALSTELFSGCLDPQNTKNPHGTVETSDRSVERRCFCQKGPKMAIIRGNFRLFRKNDTSIRTDGHPSLSTESGLLFLTTA